MAEYVYIFQDKVIVKRLNLPDDHGVYEVDKEEIHIDTAVKKKNLNRCMIHEMAHAVFEKSGLSEIIDEKTEEAVCKALEQGFKDSVKVILHKADGE